VGRAPGPLPYHRLIPVVGAGEAQAAFRSGCVDPLIAQTEGSLLQFLLSAASPATTMVAIVVLAQWRSQGVGTGWLTPRRVHSQTMDRVASYKR
jgi:hypothetical protein